MERKRNDDKKILPDKTFVIAMATVTAEQASRLQQAFDEGKLAEFGIREIRMAPESEGARLGLQWVDEENSRRKPKSESDRTP